LGYKEIIPTFDSNLSIQRKKGLYEDNFSYFAEAVLNIRYFVLSSTVIMGVFVSIFDFFKNDAYIAPARILPNLVMIAVAITYFISIKKRGISQSWRCVLMWSVLFSQIAPTIYTAIVP
jgi:hypothetical protein